MADPYDPRTLKVASQTWQEQFAMKGLLPSKEQAKEITKTFKAMTAASVVAPYMKQMLDTMIEASGVADIPTLFLEKLADEAAAKTADVITKWLDKMASGEYDVAVDSLSSAFGGMVTEIDKFASAIDAVLTKAGYANETLSEFATYIGAAIINPLSILYPLFDKMAEQIDKLNRKAYQFANMSMNLGAVSELGIEGEMPTGAASKLTAEELMGGY